MGIVIGQGVIALILWKVMKTFGIYAESLLYTHQQNLEIRKNMAIAENEMAAAEILRRSQQNKKGMRS